MFGEIFKNINDVPWKEAGGTTEPDYTGQTSWVLVFKDLDAIFSQRGEGWWSCSVQDAAQLAGTALRDGFAGFQKHLFGQ